MDRLLIAFTILLIMLFGGIGIMMSPKKITMILTSQPNNAVLGTLMTLASILFVIGLVGIAVMGFVVSKGQTANEMNGKSSR